jgi:hypothetical protein
LLSLILPPLCFASLSPFIAKTACVFFYNEDVQEHYCGGNSRERPMAPG